MTGSVTKDFRSSSFMRLCSLDECSIADDKRNPYREKWSPSVWHRLQESHLLLVCFRLLWHLTAWFQQSQ